MNRQLHSQRFKRSSQMLCAMIEEKVPRVMILNEARLLLNAAYGGPWKTILVLIKHELRSMWGHFMFRFEFVRTRVFRRTPDPVLEITNRVIEEDREVSKLVKEL